MKLKELREAINAISTNHDDLEVFIYDDESASEWRARGVEVTSESDIFFVSIYS